MQFFLCSFFFFSRYSAQKQGLGSHWPEAAGLPMQHSGFCSSELWGGEREQYAEGRVDSVVQDNTGHLRRAVKNESVPGRLQACILGAEYQSSSTPINWNGKEGVCGAGSWTAGWNAYCANNLRSRIVKSAYVAPQSLTTEELFNLLLASIKNTSKSSGSQGVVCKTLRVPPTFSGHLWGQTNFHRNGKMLCALLLYWHL